LRWCSRLFVFFVGGVARSCGRGGFGHSPYAASQIGGGSTGDDVLKLNAFQQQSVRIGIRNLSDGRPSSIPAGLINSKSRCLNLALSIRERLSRTSRCRKFTDISEAPNYSSSRTKGSRISENYGNLVICYSLIMML